jgi:ArsR family transcriptional regulator
MKNVARLLKLFSDETRLRILMLLSVKELCVCQLMAVLGISQPLVSRNLSLLRDADLLDERREGKMVFYSLRKKFGLPASRLLHALKTVLKNDKRVADDLRSLDACSQFQKMTGKCDMKTFLSFMKTRKGKR